jgi:hypothetical protein
MFHSIIILSVFAPSIATAQTFKPAPGNFPAKGDGDFAGGIFSVSLTDLPKYSGAGGTGSETPKSPGARTLGSGPYPVIMTTDSTLPGHTIFAPKTPLSGNLSLLFIAWSNGACMLNAGEYEPLLVEIASYGYVSHRCRWQSLRRWQFREAEQCARQARVAGLGVRGQSSKVRKG